MLTRRFTIINELGQVCPLYNLQEFAFLTSPSGLGFGYNTSYQQVGNNFVEDIKKLKQGTFTADLNFLNYDKYKNFVDFIESSNNLKLLYEIPYKTINVKQFFVDINLQALDKTEKQKTGIITEGVVFEYKSLWYETNEITINLSEQEGEMRWNFIWNPTFYTYESRNIIFNNEGHVDAPFTVEIDGIITNPSISIYRDGKRVNKLEIDIDIAENEKFLYSSVENDVYIYKQNADKSIMNLFTSEYIDIYNQNTFRLQRGINNIVITAEEIIRTGKITIFPRYKAV